MRYLTNQEIFTKVKTHLLKQRRRSNGWANGACMYRGTKGSKCAVGCVITDEAYSPDIEFLAIPHVAGNISTKLDSALELSGISSDSYLLLKDLQVLHDTADVATWDQALKTVALNHDLEY